jgi:hypothetical protein
MNFESLIGKTVPAIIPMIHPKELLELTVRGVEFGGLWVESKELTDGFLSEMGVPAIRTPIFFVPFQAIKLAFYSGENLALSEKAFGL